MKKKAKNHVSVHRGVLGLKITTPEKRTIKEDNSPYYKNRQKPDNRPYSIEEMMLYDDTFYDD